MNEQDDFLCIYAPTKITFTSFVIIAVLVSIITSALMTPIDTLFTYIAAPLADDDKVHRQDMERRKSVVDAVGNAGRRMSNVALTAASTVAQGARRASAVLLDPTSLFKKQKSNTTLVKGTTTLECQNRRYVLQRWPEHQRRL